MLRSLLIKVPAVLAAALCLALLPAPRCWIGAAIALLAGAGALAAVVFDVNSTFWAPTLWKANRRTNEVALTFDDGPDPEFTPRVLAVLAEKNVPAAFFVVGRRVDAHPDIVAAIDRAGHMVGAHSYSHDLAFHTRLHRGLRHDLTACNASIERAIGRAPRLFRSPQGFKNPALGDVLYEMGMTAIGWQVRGLDAVERDSDKIVGRILRGASGGGVILLHDGAGLLGTSGRQPTLDALPRVIDALRAAGLEFARLDTLLGVEAYRASG